MRRILTVLSALALSVIVTFGQSQQSGNYDNDLSGDLVGGYPEVATASGDTTFIINENFSGDLSSWTEVGGVAIVSEELVITVINGGADYIKQDIDLAESTCEWDYCFSDTVGMGNQEYFGSTGFYNTGTSGTSWFVGVVKHSLGPLYWRISYENDGTKYGYPTVILPDTEYKIKVHFKHESVDGQDDGLLEVWVNGDSLLTASGLNTRNTSASEFRVGNHLASSLNVLIKVDNVKVWEPSGLP